MNYHSAMSPHRRPFWELQSLVTKSLTKFDLESFKLKIQKFTHYATLYKSTKKMLRMTFVYVNLHV